MSIENPSFENEPKPEELKESTADKIKKWKDSLPDMKGEINKEEYKKVKKEMERFRKEHGAHKSKEELEKEDSELRKQFGLE